MAASTADLLLNASALPVIDLRLFTQSDLRALAKSTSTFDFSPDADVPVPKIDRAVFNESAGSRKQTYSRLRLAPRKTEVSGSSRIEKVDEADEWENRRIVEMLKELVGEESGEEEVFEGLVAVDVECDPELDVEDVGMVRQEVRVEIGSVSPVRRKRGRPRKDDSHAYVSKIVLNDDSDDVDEFGNGDGKVKKRDEDDMEMANKNGVAVDLVALGNVDDPFGPEMRRRTEGMSTKEELLEFLNGLEGQWVSRRRKRKIVDASAFGDVLPTGWKLMFSIKKKAGHAWLICRQYISPSGREFISCKEVSSYLQHLSGMQSEEFKMSFGNDKSIVPSDTITKENVGNEVVQDDAISDHHPSRLTDRNLGNYSQHESEIALSDPVKIGVSLHTLPSSPKIKSKRRKLGTLVSDGVIITDGKFECQFCHKIFDERRRYNGHVGVHVRSVEALRGRGNKAAGNDLISVSGVHPAGSALDVAVISTSGAQANHNDVTLNDVTEQEVLRTNLTAGSEVGDLTNKSNIEIAAANAEVSQNICDESFLGKSDQKSENCCQTVHVEAGTVDSSISFGAEKNQYVAPQIDLVKNKLHELFEGNIVSTSEVKTVGEEGISEKSTVVFNTAGKLSNGDEKSNGDSTSFGEKLIADKAIPCENNVGGLLSNENDEHTVDITEQFGNEKFPFNFGIIDNEQGNVCAFYHQKTTGSSLIAPFTSDQRHISTNSDNDAVATGMEYKEKNSEEIPPNLASNEQTLTFNNNFFDGISGNSSVPVSLHPGNSGIQPAIISSSSHGALGVNDWSGDTQKIFGVTHLFPSLNQNLGATSVEPNSTGVISKSPLKSPTFNLRPAFDSVVVSSDSLASKEFWKDVVVPSNSVARSLNEIPLNIAAGSSLGHGKGSDCYPFSSHEVEQNFNRNDMVEMNNGSIHESRLERDYVTDFVNQFESGQSSQGNTNMFSTRPVESRADEVGFPLNSELKISLGNDHSRLDAVNRNLKGQSLVLSGNERLGLQNNSISFFSSPVEETGDQRASGSSLMDQYGQQQFLGLQNNLNQAYNGSMWGGQRFGAVGNFVSNDLMAGFSSGQTQRSENALTHGNWSGVNSHGLSGAPLPRDQPSGYLHTLQMMSSKGEQLFDVAQKFNNIEGFEDQRGGFQQREYNFLNAQAKPYTQDPNVTPYGQQMQPSYDPTPWLGRQTSFPQVPARNPPTASCVWCSNMFYPESLNSFSQADTIVPTCPSCKAKMSEQLNLF